MAYHVTRKCFSHSRTFQFVRMSWACRRKAAE
uniref:Uncharacterized protein n=1 Tax=Anguilla anguilla TaxID=7936 RepID=A0A0E9UQ62_ANGAN